MSASSLDENAAFPKLLHRMVTEESKRDSASPVRWLHNGDAFVIDQNNPALHGILMKYFSHGKYKSLQKQLISHGIKKGSNGKYEGAYHHRMFHRDKEELLLLMKPTGGKKSTNIKRKKEAAIEQHGTRKRKVKQRKSDVSESSTLIREAGLVKNGGTQETYYYGSDISTSNENSTLGEELNDYQKLGPDLVTKKAKVVQAEKKLPSKVAFPMMGRDDLTSDNYLKKQDAKSALDQQQTQQKDAEEQRPPSNKIQLPFSLKKVMIQTFESISEKGLVCDLPSSMSVRKVLGMYVDAKVYQASEEFVGLRRGYEEQEKLKRRRVGWKNLADGIAMFFEKAMRSSRLLYRQEVPQLDAFLASSKPEEPVRLSDVYGCEHLLRLILVLPDILKDCLTEEKTGIVLHDVTELVKFLHRQQDYLFVTSFRKLTKEEVSEIQKQRSASDG